VCAYLREKSFEKIVKVSSEKVHPGRVTGSGHYTYGDNALDCRNSGVLQTARKTNY
jgi:hypothetical protein